MKNEEPTGPRPIQQVLFGGNYKSCMDYVNSFHLKLGTYRIANKYEHILGLDHTKIDYVPVKVSPFEEKSDVGRAYTAFMNRKQFAEASMKEGAHS